MDGSFNHVVFVSTKQSNSADSAASNIGFRCASSGGTPSNKDATTGITSPNVRAKSAEKGVRAAEDRLDL